MAGYARLRGQKQRRGEGYGGVCISWIEPSQSAAEGASPYLNRPITARFRQMILVGYSIPKSLEIFARHTDIVLQDRGDAMRAVNLSIKTSLSVPQPPFARLCQSAMLLSRSMESILSTQLSETDQNKMFSVLSEQLINFLSIIDSEVSSIAKGPDDFLLLLGPLCLTGSALFLILDLCSCPEKMKQKPGYNGDLGAKSNDQLQIQVWASSLLKSVTDRFSNLGIGWIDTLEPSVCTQKLGRFPSLALDAFYSTMATLLWYRREGMEDWNEASLTHVQRILQAVAERWKAALEYMNIAERSDTAIYHLGVCALT